MKKILLVLAALAAMPALAADKYGMAGCGLGSMIFGDQQGYIQLLASTTNGIYGNQTFGITSGTSNCLETSAASGKRAALFITANRESLEKDIARGSGESLSNLSEVMNCKSGSFNSTLQSNYKTIFPSSNATTESVVDSIVKLGQNC